MSDAALGWIAIVTSGASILWNICSSLRGRGTRLGSLCYRYEDENGDIFDVYR